MDEPGDTMSKRFHRNALFAALLALGVAGPVNAQAPGSGSASGSTTSGATSGSAAGGGSASTAQQGKGGSTGLDKGAGTGAAGSAATGSTPRAGDAKSASSAKSGDAQVSGSERRFIETAARHGMAEVQLGKMAQDKAQDQQVKDFGRRMVEDHGKANDQLKTLASAKGVTLPTEPDGQHKRLADRLAKMSGADFDRNYMKEMVDDHEKDVKEFRQMAKSAKDVEVRTFASTQLPILEEHLKMAQAMHAASAKGGTSTAKAGSRNGGTTASGATSGASTTAGTAPGGGTASGTGTVGAGTTGGGVTASGAAGGATTSGSTGAASGSSSKGGASTAGEAKK
jgi:putative membrane protein